MIRRALGGWRPGPCPFITTPGFRCSASLRGLRPNEFLVGFISIRVAFFMLVCQNLTQPSSFTRTSMYFCLLVPGRLQVTNSIFSALPMFTMCTLSLHKTVIKQIDKFRKHCLWRGADINDRRPPKAAWELV